MKLLKKFLIGLVVVILLFVGIGFLLPSYYSVSRSIVIDAPRSEIYPRVARLSDWPKWTVWNTETYPDMTTEYSGPEMGVGSTSTWQGETSGNGSMVVTEASKYSGIEYTLAFEGFDPSEGYVRFEPLDSETVQTRVSLGMSGDMGLNPINRWFGLLMDGMMGSEFDQCLQGLKTLVESETGSDPAPPVDDPEADSGESASDADRDPAESDEGAAGTDDRSTQP